MLASFIGVVTLTFLLAFLLSRIIFQRILRKQQNSLCLGDKFLFSVAFFHPYCNAGGGGERVLWAAIKAIQQKYPDILCVVYTGDVTFSPQQILDRAKERFNISIAQPVQFKFLHYRKWVEAENFPIFTLLGQSLGSVVLGLEALSKFVPDIYIDSMGYAFTLPIFKYLGGCRTGAYVHYPTISVDMLNRVSSRKPAENNKQTISQSAVLTRSKLIYYHIFAWLYGLVGKCADMVSVNSSWTKGHIEELWNARGKVNLIFPPCNVEEFMDIPIEKEVEMSKENWRILSIAQFRPEKDYPLQMKGFALFQKKCKNPQENFLVLIGGCRSKEDEERVQTLRKLAEELQIEKQVIFKLNIPFSELKEEMAKATVGIHSMWNEHFGIGIVESMAAGLLMLAHNSGGPKLDIVVEHDGESTGFLAHDEESYAQGLEEIKNMEIDRIIAIKCNARRSTTKFSDKEFETRFLSALEIILVSE